MNYLFANLLFDTTYVLIETYVLLSQGQSGHLEQNRLTESHSLLLEIVQGKAIFKD